jgi:hypothetical protein
MSQMNEQDRMMMGMEPFSISIGGGFGVIGDV